MNEQVTPDKETRDELDIPELSAPSSDEGELLEPIADDEVEVINAPEVELPDDPSQAVPVLLAALGDTQAEAAEYLETVQRVAAEFDNFRKRAARQTDAPASSPSARSSWSSER